MGSGFFLILLPQITGEFIHQGEDGEWVCPDSNDVMEKAGVLTIEEYIQRRRDTILP
jgi:hypothetical protein